MAENTQASPPVPSFAIKKKGSHWKASEDLQLSQCRPALASPVEGLLFLLPHLPEYIP